MTPPRSARPARRRASARTPAADAAAGRDGATELQRAGNSGRRRQRTGSGRRRRRRPRARRRSAAVGGGGRGGAPNVINAPANVEPLRFYWNAPIEISPHNPAIIYMAGAVLLQVDQSRRHVVDEPDGSHARTSTAGRPKCRSWAWPATSRWPKSTTATRPVRTATQVRESPSRPGVIWVGTEDGNLQVSQDGGETFTNVYGNITGAPKRLHAHLAHRAFALRPGHGVRGGGQSSHRRLEAVPVQDHRLTARRGPASPAIFPPRATSTRCARTTTIRTCSSSARSSACS